MKNPQPSFFSFKSITENTKMKVSTKGIYFTLNVSHISNVINLH